MVRIISLIMAAVAFSAASAFSQPIEWEEVASGVEAPQVLMLNEDKHGGIYAVTSGGIYYSRDYAASWEWVCDSSAFNAAYVIDTNTIVAIKLDRSYRSTDRGKTWSPSYKFPSDNISIYTFQTGWDSDSKIYFWGTTGAPLYYTKNGGKSWDIIHYGPKLTADTSIKLRFASSFAVSNYALHLQTIYDNPNKRGSLGLATSTDNGETWRLNPYFSDEGDLKADNIGNVWSFMNPEYQYSTDSGKTFNRGWDGKYLTRGDLEIISDYSFQRPRVGFDGRESLLLREDTTILEARTLGIRKISPVKNKEILLSPSARGFHAITLLRGRNGYIYAGTTGGVYRSSDLGYTWSRMSGGMTKGADVYNIDVAPSGEVLVSTTGGVYRSTDNLQSWQWMSGTISNVCATAAIRLGRDSILCSTYDGPQLTTDNGVTWSNTKYDRLELFYSLIATPSGTIFGAADDDGYPRISTDRGKTWATIQSPAGKSARFAYHKPSRSFFGVAHSWGINRFNDRGDILDTWGSSKKPNTAHDVAFDSTRRIYFATSGGLYTAQNVNGPAGESGLTFNLSRVAVNGAGQVLAGDWDGNMYFRRTTTFEKCSQGLHGAPIRSIAVLPDQRVLVGTDWGLFVSKAPSTTVTAPELQQPVNASRPLRIGLILTWKNVQSARHYHLQVSRDSSFTDFLINDSTLTETRKDLPILGFAERYYWRVRSVLQAQRSPWSEAWSFTTLPDKPSSPQLRLPANNAEVAAPVATLEWRAAQYAEKYRLQVSTAASFATLLIDDTTLTGQTYEFGNLSAGVKYYWRVRGSNQIGASSWSDTWSFRATATDVAEAGAGGLRVYPNPATDELRVELPAWSGSGEAELSLVGLRGEVVRRRSVIAPISEVNFDLKGLPSGRYYLRAKSAGYTATVSVDIKR